jgi:hypothetical protein
LKSAASFFEAKPHKRNALTLSTAEAVRFLHTAPSTLGDTYVSAFTPSWFRSYLQGLCHQPVNGFFRLEKPYI